MGSAHCLTEWNIWVKLNENHAKGSGLRRYEADTKLKGKSHDLEVWSAYH